MILIEEKHDKESKVKQLMNLDIKDLVSNIKKKSKSRKKIVKPNKNKIVSFDIDEEFIKIVVGRYRDEEIKIYKCIEVSTPSGCIDDGKIINHESLLITLNDALLENKIKVKYGSVTTNSTQIINREIIIPKVEDDEIETVVNYEISRYLPINLNDCIIQTLIIDEIEIEGEEKLKVHTICYPEKMARDYYDLIHGLKLNPYSLDIKFNSLNKVINYSQDINDTNYDMYNSQVFIDIGPVATDINIYKEGKIDFTRIIKQGYKTLEAYEVQYENGTGVELFIEEIQRIFQFYRNKVRGNKIDKVYLLGEGSRVDNLDKYMSQRLDTNVESIETVGFVEFKSKYDNDEIYKYLNAIGTIIRI